MFSYRRIKRVVALFLSAWLVVFGFQASLVQAAMVATDNVISTEQHNVDKEALKAMLADQAVKDKLASLGVDQADVENRIDSLTPSELAQFNAQMEEMPAGSGVAEVVVLFLVVFVVTDMLCATDIFSFVRCIN
ncbi:PA2779 family protein [Zooshikella harenae]|uniref:PA2779 family protein n=1 Tax=Zooshikella harenae TaxID=2827238 RepID=A0ABS5ZEF5_9GAMM|nr:PA2779 family protein [Zooshikella harenae]MBU2712379.1 PA2779 family protein [Zooshikella harenae]